MAFPQDVVVVRMPDVTLTASSVSLTGGTSTIGSIMALSATAIMKVVAGGNNSAPADIRGFSLFAVIVPSTFDGSVVAVQVGIDGTNWFNLYDINGAQVLLGSGAVAAGRAYDLQGEVSPWPYIRFVCTTVQSTTDTDFVLVMKQ